MAGGRRAVRPRHGRETTVAGGARDRPRADFRALKEKARLPHGAVAKRIRRLARREAVDLVVMGSENAGRIFTPLSSVGGGVATDRRYDVFLVRREESALFGRSNADR